MLGVHYQPEPQVTGKRNLLSTRRFTFLILVLALGMLYAISSHIIMHVHPNFSDAISSLGSSRLRTRKLQIEEPPENESPENEPSETKSNATESRKALLASVLLRHPLPSSLATFPQPAGICIAIPVVPRNSRSLHHSMRALSLLRFLSDRRVKAPLIGHSLQAIVYSAHCAASKRFSPVPSKETKWLTAEVLKGLNEEIQKVVNKTSIPTDVLEANDAICEIFADPDKFVRPLVSAEAFKVDSWERIQWRSKEVLDFVYVMSQCLHTNPEYVLFLEDDVEPVNMWDRAIEIFVSSTLAHEKDWPFVSLYNPESFGWRLQHGDKYTFGCCTQAVLFKSMELRKVLQLCLQKFADRPVDYLLHDFLQQHNASAYIHVPSLFQHVGQETTRYFPVPDSKIHKDNSFSLDLMNFPYRT